MQHDVGRDNDSDKEELGRLKGGGNGVGGLVDGWTEDVRLTGFTWV